MRFNTPEEVIAWADQAAKHDYEKHLPIHTDPDGTTWQVDKNPYATVGARYDWQKGFNGTPPQPWEGAFAFHTIYQRGAAMARLLATLNQQTD